VSIKKLFLNIEKALSGNHDDNSVPDFTTTNCGKQILFNKESKLSILDIFDLLNLNEKDFENKIGKDVLLGLIRQNIAELFVRFRGQDICHKQLKKELKAQLFSDIEDRQLEYTHHFPASSLFILYANSRGEFTLGPVRIQSRLDWLDSVDFHHQLIENHANEKEKNRRWKSDMREILTNKNSDVDCGFLTNSLHNAIEKSWCLVSISINGYEYSASKKYAEIIAKSALDSISLVLGDSSYFFQQVLYSQALPPISTSSIVSHGGYLDLPGMELGKQIPIIEPKQVNKMIDHSKNFVSHIELALHDAVNVVEGTHTPLYRRWFTALDWYAEGCRENNDSIALAKIATSLDVLSNGGKFGGILDMVSDILQVKDVHSQMTFKNREYSLNEVVKEIYDNGRSKILHGNQIDRMKSHCMIRELAEIITRNVLIHAVELIDAYKGKDKDNAFKNIRSKPKGI